MYKVYNTKRTAMTRRRVISTYPRRVISTAAMMRRKSRGEKRKKKTGIARFLVLKIKDLKINP